MIYCTATSPAAVRPCLFTIVRSEFLMIASHCIFLNYFLLRLMDRDSSVDVQTRYGLDGPGIESRWGGGISALVQTGPGAYPASYTLGTVSIPVSWR